MPGAKKFDLNAAPPFLNESPQDRLSRLMDSSVADSTKKQYESLAAQARQVVAKAREVHVTEVDLVTIAKEEFHYIMDVRKQLELSGGEATRSALLFTLTKRGVERSFLGDRDCVKLADAVDRASRERAKQRGALTEKMEDELLEKLSTFEGGNMLRSAIVLQLYGALRIGEFKKLQVNDLLEDYQRGTSQVLLRENKARKGGRRTILKDVPRAFVEAFHAVRSKPYGEKGYLFPNNVNKLVNQALKKAAVELNWPDEFVLDTSHVMRHTGCTRIKEVLIDHFSAQMAQQSVGVNKHYTRHAVGEAQPPTQKDVGGRNVFDKLNDRGSRAKRARDDNEEQAGQNPFAFLRAPEVPRRF